MNKKAKFYKIYHSNLRSRNKCHWVKLKKRWIKIEVSKNVSDFVIDNIQVNFINKNSLVSIIQLLWISGSRNKYCKGSWKLRTLTHIVRSRTPNTDIYLMIYYILQFYGVNFVKLYVKIRLWHPKCTKILHHEKVTYRKLNSRLFLAILKMMVLKVHYYSNKK